MFNLKTNHANLKKFIVGRKVVYIVKINGNYLQCKNYYEALHCLWDNANISKVNVSKLRGL